MPVDAAGVEQAEVAADIDALADTLGDAAEHAQEALHLEVAGLRLRLGQCRAGAEQAEAAADIDALADALGDASSARSGSPASRGRWAATAAAPEPGRC